MAQRISPQGYIYGEEPYSEHPFWEHEIVDANIEPITITPTNQQQVIEATALIDGYAPITVEAAPSSEPVIEPLSVTLTNQQQVITAPAGVDGYSPVTIPAAPQPTEPVIQPLSVTPTNQQQTISPPSGVDGYAPVVVGATPPPVPPVIQSLSITPSSQQQVITAPTGVDGYSPITVAAAQTANLDTLVADADLDTMAYIPDQGYDGFSSVDVNPAIPLTMLTNPSAINQVYVMTQSGISSAQAIVFDHSSYLSAAMHGAGSLLYEVTYFITPTMSTSAISAFESDVANMWQGYAYHVYAYYRQQTGGMSLHTII